MFTGIILAVGTIADIQPRGGDCRLKIATGKLSLADCALGDSIAVNGVCLTAVELGDHYFCADVSNETLSRTILKSAKAGVAVNLELAMTPSTRLGGHIVSGHVDGIGKLVEKQADGRSIRFKFKAPDSLASVDGACFSVNIVPHTLQETTLGSAEVGVEVNLEVDLLARYLERLMQGDAAAYQQGSITEALLHQAGFIK
jgi:riboflavin synthase